MREVSQDLWTVDCDWICIPTNGATNKSGNAIMGRGCALEAKKLIPDIETRLGYWLRKEGNHVHWLGIWQLNQDTPAKSILSFPTKYHWRDLADLGLIAQSCKELIEWVNGAVDNGRTTPTIALPRPGTGCGGRSWKYEVKPILETYFGTSYIESHVVIVSKPGEE